MEPQARSCALNRTRPLALCLCLLTAACGDFILGVNEGEEASLRVARVRWDRERPAAYSYVLERLCFCPLEVIGPVLIVVHGDSVQSRNYTATGQAVGAQFAALFGPVESVFDVIEDALDRGADSLSVRYDPGRGYPTSVVIDYVRNAVDDELTLRVSDFRTLTQ